MADLKPGDYIGLYLDNVLIHTGVFKDQGTMESGRKVYQVLLVKNIFQRNFPEIHLDADIRPVTWEQVQEEIRQLKVKLPMTFPKRCIIWKKLVNMPVNLETLRKPAASLERHSH